MTNKLEIDIDLAERIERALNQIGVQDHLCDYALVSDVKKELRALLAAEPTDYPECSGTPESCPENEGYGCCKIAAPVVERQPTGSRERFQKWVLATEHPALGFLDGHWLERGDDREGYANEYVQGLWVAFKEFADLERGRGEPVANIEGESNE